MSSAGRTLLCFMVAGWAAVGCAGGAGPMTEATGGAGAPTSSGSGGGPAGSGGRGGASSGTPAGTGGSGAAASGGSGGTGNGSASGGASASGGSTGMGGSRADAGATGTAGMVGGPETGGAGVAGRGVAGMGGRGGAAGGGGSAPQGGAGGQPIGGGGGSGGKPDQSALPAVTIHMAGDSTMANYASTTTQEGWGQELGQFFISKVTIDNQALGGANIQSFYGGSRWKTLMNNVRAGDYVMAAFGINDSGTTHGPVTPQDFQAQMEVMADEVAAKKATFIPTTSSPLQMWVGGKETNTRLQPYCDATKAVGMKKGLLVDDLNARALEYYDMIGEAAASMLTFNGDKAHFNKQGATEMARLASQELQRIHSPLAAYLK